ncbi:uncharacterized protein ColSpa_11197 [Colletotrichum spaethianum]|uniref:Uncharacterized protein n=1 Tax=Colletotrichum spaethianum TaxID=700344 RepID=A0AA37UL27_9PEZI|nr:uncharacterized protein ColSpa_11197 [Colletotrichum spaethianum]GKT51016.1 hypothetical protein ColSpa_11197 [Colletotrichum spaethianum]
MPTSNTDSTTSVEEGFQEHKIPSKYVSSPQYLSSFLKQNYGDINYTVEMRHNFYSIKAPLTERQINWVWFLHAFLKVLEI